MKLSATFKYAVIPLLLVLTTRVCSQVKMTFSEMELSRSASKPMCVGQKENALLMIAKDDKKGSVHMQWMTADSLREVGSRNFDYTAIPGQDVQFEHGAINPSEIQLFFSSTGNGVRTVFQVPFSFGLEVSDLPVPILTATFPKKQETRFAFENSPNGVFCLTYVVPEGVIDENTPLSFALSSKPGSPIITKDLYLPYENNIFELNQFKVDDFGRVYILSGLSPQKNTFASNRNAPRNETYILLTYDHSLNKLKEFNIALPDKWVNSVSIMVSPVNEAIVTGLYSNTLLPGSAGVFYMRLNKSNGTLAASGISAFERPLIQSFNSNSSAREMEQLYLDFIHPTEDGSLWLAGEQYYMTERTYMDPTFARPTTVYEYHYGNILLIKLNPEGEIMHQQVVPKYQVSQNDGGKYSSYGMLFSEKEASMLFFDHPKNELTANERYKMNNPNKSQLVAVSFSEGILHKQILVSTAEKELVPKDLKPAPPAGLTEFGRYQKEVGLFFFQYEKDFWKK